MCWPHQNTHGQGVTRLAQGPQIDILRAAYWGSLQYSAYYSDHYAQKFMWVIITRRFQLLFEDYVTGISDNIDVNERSRTSLSSSLPVPSVSFSSKLTAHNMVQLPKFPAHGKYGLNDSSAGGFGCLMSRFSCSTAIKWEPNLIFSLDLYSSQKTTKHSGFFLFFQRLLQWGEKFRVVWKESR